MPEIKHQFTGGKMNKDVDERLVPNGEYRHAMNVQVSTSEGSDVGTIQNVLGNSKINIPFDITKQVCVGSISDEKMDSVYFFLAGPRFNYGRAVLLPGVFSWDYIIKLKDNVVEVVFTDTKLVVSKSEALDSLPAFDYATNTIYTPPGWVASVSVGDVLEKIININTDEVKVAANTVIHTHVAQFTGDPEFMVFDNLDVAFGANTECYLFLRSGCLNLDADRSITGINIIDDMLFWTDGVTEPKKINLQRSIEGTQQDGQVRTLLINKDQNITVSSGINVAEKHITVIKKAPSRAPTLKSLTSLREDGVSGVAYNVNFTDGATTSPTLKLEGDNLIITIGASTGVNPPDIQIGDVILLNSMASNTHPPENYMVRAVVNVITHVGVEVEFGITIVSISPNTPMYSTGYFVAVSEVGQNLFEHKFPRFACRYKYEDGEYSSIGPFSEVAFVAGHFSYHPTEAYNKGMVNNLKSLKLKDFISYDIPKDVVQVDLLYKDEASPVIYTVSSIKPSDIAWLAAGTFPGSFGSYEITTENIYAVLPSNQSLRTWDNVPRSALAQEVIGNRIVYANYLQNYNIDTLPGVLANIGVRATSGRSGAGKKSIKSLRTYNVGVVYGDQYGRETPVFTNNSSNQTVTKDMAGSSTLINAEINTPHPLWAKYYKFFVKETSNEYYNLALGRIYDAEDGNVWLAFPSVDRNKVDEDTYLILKKGVENNEVVVEEARYKIVAIKNEAPEYIKTTFTTIARPVAWPGLSTDAIFGGSGGGNEPKEPVTGGSSFYIDLVWWSGDVATANQLGMPDLEEQWDEKGNSELYVSFIGDIDGGAVQSEKYLITKVVSIDATNAIGTDNAVYEVFLSKPITSSDSWISDTPGVLIANTDYRPVIHKKEVKNKPEFDGRFFVKIRNDEHAKHYLSTPQSVDINWRITASADIYYLRDYNADQIELNVGTPVGNNSTTNAVSGISSSSYKKSHWKSLLKFGGSNMQGRWFIDQASYAGTQPLTSALFADAVTNSNMTDLSTTQTYLYDNGFWGGDGSVTDSYGTGSSLGTAFQHGISSWSSSSAASGVEYRLTLSYSAIEPHIGKQTDDKWAVGDTSNSHEVAQKDFADQIKTGSKFRMGADHTKTYTIVSVSKERVYNHRAALPEPYNGSYDLHGNPDWSKAKFLKDFARPNNRRLAYHIVYTIDGGDVLNDLLTNAGVTGADAFNTGDLQFIETYDTDRVEPISTYPAVFETEPRKDADLDIYYEASGKIPTSIDSGDGEMLIPIGSTLRLEPEIEDSFDGSITANGWGGIGALGIFQQNLLFITPAITFAQYFLIKPVNAPPPILVFDNISGGTSYVRFVGAKFNDDYTMIVGFEVETINKVGLNWFNCWSFGNGVESNRIGDTYNKPYLSNGPKASSTLDKEYIEETRRYGLIYSGIYNSTPGVNNLNQFIAAEKITKDINPAYGSIQKLHTRSTADGDLIALCEDRVLKILADRDAIYNADGNPQLIASENVLGQTIPFAGEYGISKNPESFVAESYRAYFTDKVRGTVMRLSKDGLTPISDHGMKDWFRDNLKLSHKLVGGYDDKKDEYNLTLSPREVQTFTISDELVVKSTIIVLIPSVLA